MPSGWFVEKLIFLLILQLHCLSPFSLQESTLNRIRDLLSKRPSAKLHPSLSFEASRQRGAFLRAELFTACLEIAKLHDGDEVGLQNADILIM